VSRDVKSRDTHTGIDHSHDRAMVLEGCHAVSYAVKMARVQVIAAYPITPQTAVVEKLSEMCASGELDARFMMVESEHSAMASCVGASSAGVRAFTATSSQGLALMHEMLHWAAGARLPIVMVNVNRALGPPWNIQCDHQDSISQRDTGWMQLFCENNQEVFDTVLQAFRIAETISLPCMVNLDAFFLSHTTEPVIMPSQEEVDRFLPPRTPVFSIDTENPHTYNGLARPDSYMELRHSIHLAMEHAREVIDTVDAQFLDAFGRSYGGQVEMYRLEDARYGLITSATITGNARIVVDELRESGVPIGLLKIRSFRPFPVYALRNLLPQLRAATIIDRSISFGKGGVLFDEIQSSLFAVEKRPLLYGYIAGLGGRDVGPDSVRDMCKAMIDGKPPFPQSVWFGLKES
jgi:pyruvate/2-oxoacid:ferredoxin oxidoreductase alpha subunit